MLSQKDNDELCRIGPGTIMGNLMRQYWVPALRSDELPAPDCPPVRVKLLGEELIAFRTTSGAVGLMQNGWKFDVTGACVDMPSEPAESNFRNKVRAKAYPCVERGSIVWTYMGPRETPPPLPEIEANMLPEGEYQVTVLERECNWVQALERRSSQAGKREAWHYGLLRSRGTRSALRHGRDRLRRQLRRLPVGRG